MVFSFTLCAMEEDYNNSTTKENLEHLDKKEKKDDQKREFPTLSDITQRHVLSLKTLAALVIGHNFYANMKDLDENQIQNICKILQELPDGLPIFIIACYQASTLKYFSERKFLQLLNIIHPGQNAHAENSSAATLKELLESASRSGCPLLEIKVINFSKEHNKAVDVSPFLLAIIRATATESLIDMGLNNPQMIEELRNDLTLIGEEIDNNQIDINMRIDEILKIEYGSIYYSILSPLSFAIARMLKTTLLLSQFRILMFLLEKGANVNINDGEPLDSAHTRASIAFLCKNGANPNFKNPDDTTGLSPLEYIFDRTWQCLGLDKAQYLIENGGNINDKYILSHLCSAIHYNSVELVKFFLDNDAKIYKEDEHGFSPFDSSLKLIDEPNEATLMVIDKALQTKPTGNFISIMKTLIGNDFEETSIKKQAVIKDIFIGTGSVNDQDEEGNTPLMAACDLNLTDLAKFFIENGADTKLLNNSAITAYVIAREHNNIELMEILHEDQYDDEFFV